MHSFYDAQIIRKLATLNKLYARKIFVKCAELSNVMALKTTEHYRSVPESGWEPVSGPMTWGGEYMNLWVKGSYTVTAETAGKKLYAVPHIECPEIMFYNAGKPSGLFAPAAADVVGAAHEAQLITAGAECGEVFEMAFECYAGQFCAGCFPYDNYGKYEPTEGQFTRKYSGVDICVMDETVKDFVFDMKELLKLASLLPETNATRRFANETLLEVYPMLVQYPLDVEDSVWHASVERCLAVTRRFFEEHRSAGSTSLFGKIGIIGHSHMDTAWLWSIDETIRKCARTYSNVLTLMEQYDEYTFVQSSALHLDWMRCYYPSIFEGIKKMVAAGRYEPNGGVFVECDCNITSGEMMIRQFLKGQQFTREHFGYTSDCFWLPDTFGYNASIPQIMLGCDVKYFYTTKISWNDTNKFPYDSFIWQGIDGSRVLTHFNLIHRFPDTENVLYAQNEIKLKTRTDKKLIAYGYGDGGGGPSYGMLESARRVSGLEGLPAVEHTTVSRFMRELEKDIEKLPVYNGELYLEDHRGTLTSMHDVKRLNRKAEQAMHDMELLNVMAGEPPCPERDELLTLHLQNQFHDILPGTSIPPVTKRSIEELGYIAEKYRDYTQKYMQGLTDGDDCKLTVFNTLGFGRNDDICLENVDGVVAGQKNQHYTDVMGRRMLAFSNPGLEAFSAKTFTVTKGSDDAESPFVYDGRTLETPFAVISFDENGYIGSFIDKATGRELRRPGGLPLNAFLLAEDVPEMYDNWNIDCDIALKYELQTGFVKREVASVGALQVRLRSVYKIGAHSELTQDILAYACSPRVDFHTRLDWKENHRLLKTGFDLNILSSYASHEIQFGHIVRPTTRNNMEQMARFEVCNHKWTDLSEQRFGVALLNDCKYGISAEGSDIRLTLEKSGTHPDFVTNRGIHETTYSLMPHDGGLSARGVIQPAYALNYPFLCVKGGLKREIPAFITLSQDNIIAETVKPAENADGAYVLRLYEAERNRTRVELRFSHRPKRVFLTNMLEDKKEELAVKDGKLTLEFHPFEIKTLLVERD